MAGTANKKKRAGHFTRSANRRKPSDYTDLKGTVRVRIALANPENPATFLAGNLSRQFSVANTTVGEVVDVIELALFGDEQ